MSFNGSGTFLINTAGNPVVTGTTISSTWLNALTADIATGLSTCITKDGQTTPTANIPMGSNKITGLANGTVATDAAAFGQLSTFGVPGYTTTATAATTTVLTVASTQLQYFTGVTTQIVTLPVTSTLVLGFSFTIVNNSTGVVTVNSSGGNAVVAMVANSQVTITCILTSGTTAASWNIEYTGKTAVTGSGNLVLSTSPTLVTPVLGAATATSINFGQTSLNYYQEGTWTPVLAGSGTAGAPTYVSQVGVYTRIGRTVVNGYEIYISAKTSMVGNTLITGFPFTFAAAASPATTVGQWAWCDLTANYTSLFVLPSVSTTQASIFQAGDNVDIATLGVAALSTASGQVRLSGTLSSYV